MLSNNGSLNDSKDIILHARLICFLDIFLYHYKSKLLNGVDDMINKFFIS